MRKSVFIAAAAVAGTAGALLVAPIAQAAPQLQQLTCDGQQLTLRTNDNHSSDMGGWSAAKVVAGGSGTLIPTTFHFSAYDNTTNMSIFDGMQIKGGGHANHRQSTVTCTQIETATLGDLLEPGDELPPGASLDDDVTIALVATAVWRK